MNARASASSKPPLAPAAVAQTTMAPYTGKFSTQFMCALTARRYHGLYCLSCCWALMALLFVGGVMNLPWIASLAGLVAIEKLAPKGELVAQILGAAMIGAGVAKFWNLLL